MSAGVEVASCRNYGGLGPERLASTRVQRTGEGRKRRGITGPERAGRRGINSKKKGHIAGGKIPWREEKLVTTRIRKLAGKGMRDRLARGRGATDDVPAGV